jgi:hypothetical protein
VSTSEGDQLPALTSRVERYLEEIFGGVQRDSDGDFVVGSGSAAVWIRPFALESGSSAVRVWSITNVGVRVDDELTRFIAVENGRLVFGSLHLAEDRPSVMLGHTLLGEFLNRKELEVAIAAIGVTADHYDDQIKARSGGSTFGEPG